MDEIQVFRLGKSYTKMIWHYTKPMIQYFFPECTKVEALESATLHPAQMLGITDTKGTLEYGTDADFVLLDDELNVLHTYIAGECVWNSDEATEFTDTSMS